MSADPETHPDQADAREDAAAIRAALLELVLLKDLKTRSGETDDYRARRERAWVEARRVLAFVPSEVSGKDRETVNHV